MYFSLFSLSVPSPVPGMCIVLCTVHLPPRVSLVVAHLSGSSVKSKGPWPALKAGLPTQSPWRLAFADLAMSMSLSLCAVLGLVLVVSWSCAWLMLMLMGFLRVCVYA